MLDMIVLLGAEVPSGRAVAKKLRAEQYCCRLMASTATVESIQALDVSGIVIAGEESEGAARPDPAILSLGLPVLALGSSARSLLAAKGRRSEIHVLTDEVISVDYGDCVLFRDVEPGERFVERAEYFEMDEAYRVVAKAADVPLAFADEAHGQFFLQFGMERNDLDGTRMLVAFAAEVCKCTPWWMPENMLDEARRKIVEAVGEGEAICAISGGVDSTVSAVLAWQALGERMRCIFVDTGLLRDGEADETDRMLSGELGLTLCRIDASQQVLAALAGLGGMQDKWHVVEREIALTLEKEACEGDANPVFIKGTNLVDILSGDSGKAASHENEIPSVEPLGEFFKEEIRMLGEQLGLPKELLMRQPFPGMGLAAHIRGEVTTEKLAMVRHADRVLTEEIAAAGQDRRLSRYFVVYFELEGMRMIVLRALQGSEPSMNVARLPNDLIERTVERMTREIPGIDRVLFDVTPGAAEWPMG